MERVRPLDRFRAVFFKNGIAVRGDRLEIEADGRLFHVPTSDLIWVYSRGGSVYLQRREGVFSAIRLRGFDPEQAREIRGAVGLSEDAGIPYFPSRVAGAPEASIRDAWLEAAWAISRDSLLDAELEPPPGEILWAEKASARRWGLAEGVAWTAFVLCSVLCLWWALWLPDSPLLWMGAGGAASVALLAAACLRPQRALAVLIYADKIWVSYGPRSVTIPLTELVRIEEAGTALRFVRWPRDPVVVGGFEPGFASYATELLAQQQPDHRAAGSRSE